MPDGLPPILDYRTPPRRFENPAADPVRKAMIDTLDRRDRGPSSRIILITLACMAVLFRILLSIID